MRQIAFLFIAAGVGLAQSPTFYKDVAPILEQHCQTCHRPGEVAPMPLLSYSDARPWAKAIKTAVLSHKMPPWYADPHVGTFSNDPTLKQAEIDALVKWADNGAPEGNPSDAPTPRKFAEGWTIGKPDQILDIGTDFKVPARGTVDYTYFVVPTGFTEDKWV
jgi:hypothetical protein